MNTNWPSKKLKDVASVFSGYAFKSSDMNKSSGIPLLKIKNINGKKVSKVCETFLDPATYKKNYDRFLLQKDDFLVAMTGQGSVGRIGKMRSYEDGFLVNQRVGIVRVDSKIADPEFVYQSLATDDTEGMYFSLAMGAGQPNLSPKDIGSANIPYPPLPIQQKIAGILSAYDDLIENNLKRIKLLEELAQITYEEWFVRLRFPGHESTPISSETKLPEGWEIKKLGDSCSLTMGQSPKSEFYNFESKGLPFHQGVKDFGTRFPSNACWSTAGSRTAKEGDILFSVRAPVGRLNISLEKIILGRGLAAIGHNQNCQAFLYCQLKNKFFEENMMGGGAIFNSVTKNDMIRIELIAPDNKTLQQFEEIGASIAAEVKCLHSQNVRLREARDILLPRLMTGMIDVEQYDPTQLLQEVA